MKGLRYLIDDAHVMEGKFGLYWIWSTHNYV
jgi:hypothetical protein